MLSVRNISSGYGAETVLQGIDLDIAAGEIVAVVGANGAGKTTLLRTIGGYLRARSGHIHFDAEDIAHLAPFETARRGIVMVPQGRGIFPRLSVRENLRLGALLRPSDFATALEEVLAVFSPLSAKLGQIGEKLAVGERQMLALARALVGHPRLILLDEPSLGLGPQTIRQAFDAVALLRRERQIAFLVADQNAFQALKLADRAIVMAAGRVVRAGTGTEIFADPGMQPLFFGGRIAHSASTGLR